MSTNDLLFRMFRYQSWANEAVLNGLKEVNAESHPHERHVAIRLMNHCLVVDKIFAAHLVGEPHGFEADNTPETPELDALRQALATADRWYLDYVEQATPSILAESVPFTFTDGDSGYMTREEMLTHVVIHSGYHRGEVVGILKRVAAAVGQDFKLPRDTYAGHLHQTQPSRRLQGRVPATSAD